MILAAGLLVLLGLGLFVAGVLTGVTVLYWACVAVCVVAAVLLVATRRQMKSPQGGKEPAKAPGAAPKTATSKTATSETSTSKTTAPEPAAEPDGPEAREEASAAPATATATGEQSAAEEAPSDGVHATAHRSPGATATRAAGGTGWHAAVEEVGDPPVEEVEVTDLLLVVDLTDEVLVVDEHPRYHLEGCRWLAGRETIPLPLDEARADGFTPCGSCTPDRHLADRERARKSAR